MVCVCPCVCDDASAQWRNGVSVLCKKSDTTQLRHHNVVAILVGKRGVIGVKKKKKERQIQIPMHWDVKDEKKTVESIIKTAWYGIKAQIQF